MLKYNQMAKTNIINSIILFLWGVSIILRPFYFLKRTGTPQIADYIMVIIIGLAFISSDLKLKKEIYINVKDFFYFVSYIIFVNFIWILLTGDMSILRNSIFYFYNFLVFTSFLITYTRVKEKLIIVTGYSIFFAVILQVILSFFYLDFSGARQTLFFNSPNQLGYFALLCAVIFFIINQNVKIKDIYQALFYLSTMYLVVLSLSKAAILGFAIFLVYLFMKRFMVLLFILILLIVVYPLVDGEMKLLSNLERSMSGLGQSTGDSLAGRGYDRIVNHPQYLLFGAGEGSNKRFESILYRMEMHSGIGAIFFSYGLVGFILFLKLLYSLFKPLHKNLSYILYTLPVFFYSLAHQSFRWPLFWMLMAMVFILRRIETNSQVVLPEKTKVLGNKII